MLQPILFSTRSERIVARNLLQVARVVKSVNADVGAAANFEAVDAAV